MADENHLNLSMDVAGATLMAAGGSAPELFTSFFGTFLETEIGFGTIVGSAVFNVLFVIGMCSLLSKEVLQLTWWPLFRDCTYYVFGLMMLAVFVGVVTPGKIFLWEAVVLFIMYLGYVVMMKYNRLLYTMLTGKVYVDPSERESDMPLPDTSMPTRAEVSMMSPRPRSFSESNNGETKSGVVSFDIQHENKNPRSTLGRGESAKSFNSNRSGQSNTSNSLHCYTHGRWPGTFRAGILKLIRVPHSWVDTAGVGLVGQMAGDVHATFEEIDRNGDGLIDRDELSLVFGGLGHNLNEQELAEAFSELDLDGNGAISKAEFTKWYVKSEELILSKVKETFDRFDMNGNGMIDREEMNNVLRSLDPRTTEKDVDEALRACYQEGSPDEISYPEFSKWYINSLLYGREVQAVEEDVDGVCSSLKPPNEGGCLAYAMWIVTLPLVATLALTVPDVRRDGLAKYCYISFVLSIGWIGVYSFLMVEWATIIGNTLGVPAVVMGLTFLAAGTSVPDLLTSVIVARRGEGDMALSSSIGSNIFDILVGLPLPWIVYTAWPTKKPYVSISSDGLWINLFILLGMVILIIVTIHCAGWKLSKKVGMMMFTFYFLFLAQAIVQELPFQTCT